MQVIKASNDLKMTSLDLRELINDIRQKFGESRVENSHFVKRVEDELEGELGKRKLFVNPEGGRPAGYYDLTLDQCTLVGMRESKGVRRQVLAKLKELENLLNKPMTEAELVLWSAQRLVDLEREQEQIKAEQVEIKHQISAILEGENYMTVVGYCNTIGKRIPPQETSRIGKLATSYCKANGIEMGKAPHPVYGQVNSYPLEVLQQIVT